VVEKTAAALLSTFGSIEKILEAAADGHTAIKPRIASLLLEHAEYLDRAQEIVLLNREISVPALDTKWKSPSPSPTLVELGMSRYEAGWHGVLEY
jgi:5'-3' exonuclease